MSSPVIVHVICEGQTELHFVIQVLAPYMQDRGLLLLPSLIGDTGGHVTFARLLRDVKACIHQQGHYVTTLLDYYGLAGDWDGLDAPATAAATEKALRLEEATSARMAGELPSGVAYRREFASFNGYFLDSVKGVKEIVLNNAGPARAAETDRRSEALQKQTSLSRHASSLAAGVTELCVSLFILLALLSGVGLYLSGQLSLGRMIVGVVAIFGSFGPVIAISALPSNLTQTFASGDRVLDLLEEPPAVTPVTEGEELRFQRLDVHGLAFAYEAQPVLRGVSLTARKGEIVGLVGPSGCGKSTLLKLLLRFWEKDAGHILYNGTDVDRSNTRSLLDNVTLVSQSTYLFDETIEDNLRMAKPDATREELEEACRKASIHDFIRTLPQGYQTRVGALGDNLSAGERQRLGLARAFLHDGPVILLDEPTSNVDSINEGIILRAIARQKQDKCIILVSHRTSTMAIADRVYAIRDGIIEQER